MSIKTGAFVNLRFSLSWSDGALIDIRKQTGLSLILTLPDDTTVTITNVGYDELNNQVWAKIDGSHTATAGTYKGNLSVFTTDLQMVTSGIVELFTASADGTETDAFINLFCTAIETPVNDGQGYSPKIVNGEWYVYDDSKKAYVATGVSIGVQRAEFSNWSNKVDEIYTEKGINIFSMTAGVYSNVYVENGTTAYYGGWACGSPIEVGDYKRIYCKLYEYRLGDTRIPSVVFLDSDKNFLSCLKTINVSGASTHERTAFVDIPSGAAYVAYQTQVQAAYLVGRYFSFISGVWVTFEDNTADVDELKSKFESLNERENVGYLSGTSDYVTLSDGTTNKYGAWARSKRIELKDGDTITFELANYNTESLTIPSIVYFDEDGNFISYSGVTDDSSSTLIYGLTRWSRPKTITPPSGAKYVEFQTNTMTAYLGFNFAYINSYTNALLGNLPSWKGKNIAIIGDSISDKEHIGTTKCWWEYLALMLGANIDSYALNGSKTDYMLTELQNAYNAQTDDFKYDAIFIFGGTNDFNASTPLGEWYTEKEETVTTTYGTTLTRMHRTFTTDSSTFRGRLNNLYSYIKTNFPSCQVVALTPIHRAYATFGETNIQLDEMYANTLKLYISDYVNVVKEVGNVWSVNVIDLNAVSGLFPLYSSFDYYVHDVSTDRLHPNAKGHLRMAKAISAQLNAITADFE